MTHHPKKNAKWLPLVMLLVAGLWSSAAWSADTGSARPATRLSDAEQQAAVKFVKEHHPQLNALISRLKKRDADEYHKALRDVFKTHERLQRLERRDRPRYEVELNLWKVESRIRLVAARMAADRNFTAESQLRELLNERTDLKLQRLTLERERLNSRLERIDHQVSQLASERDAAIDKEIDRLRRSVRDRSTRVSKKSSKDAPADADKQGRSEKTSP